MIARPIHVATITLVRDDKEDRLVRRALETLSRKGYTLHVSDGGSPASFLRWLGSLPNCTLIPPRAKGLIGQVRASVQQAAASGAGVIFYSESDKADFFAQHLDDFFERARVDDRTGVVLAARSEAAFRTFPRTQQFVERTVSDLCGESIGVDGDYFYGPFVMHPRLAAYLDDVPDSLGWGWRPYVFTIAARLKMTVTHIVGDYECPVDQRADEPDERVHRIRQLSQNAAGITLGMTAPLRP
jgi:hypothetical protein